ncbi:protein kinase [Streptomyces sp. NPDC017230]|uniref:serine/threonine-protein kinase n=1 Tax=unclassified Streptomyces TaxID=2593676 RepID=UPI003798A144
MLRPLDAHAPYGIGSYRLLGTLGSGGMGTVHLALPPDGGPDDLVALKTVRRDLELQPDFRLRFRREAQAAGAVRSPYVSALVAADPDAERPWLATEYVVGPPLDEAVSHAGALPVPVVRELGADLARGLAAVHGARLVHRDLKPANVVLGAGGPRLIDFGIAQAYDATALTATGIMVGSPGFMSPEHVAGDRSVTAASDVFCLGAVLCFAATGQGPFHDDELAAIVHRIAQGRPDLSRVPGELRELITACLDPDPAQRPTTTRLVRDLDPAAANARPGVAPEPRTGAFPWPAGIARVIGEYETTVGRALLAPPAPRHAPGPAAAPQPHPSASAPSASAPSASAVSSPPAPVRNTPSAAPSRSRRGTRLRWAAGVTSGIAVGVVTAVLTATLGDNDTGSGDGGEAAGPGTASTAPPTVFVSSDMSDFGPDAMDRSRLPADWSPWSTSFEGEGEPRGCVLGGTTLVCRLHQDSGRISLEARNARDGGLLWRYPSGDDRATAGTGTAGTGMGEPGLDGTYAYVPSADDDGITVLRLRDGEPVATVGAKKGYAPVKARAHGGRLFVAYREGGGKGGALVRAFSATGERKQQWERRLDSAEPGSLEVMGDSLHLHGRAETLALDSEGGRTLAEAAERCEPVARGAAHLSCPSGVRDGTTLEKAEGDYRGERLLALSRTGVLLSSREGASDAEQAELVARDVTTGRVRWTEPWSGRGTLRIAGDRLVVADQEGVGTSVLADGQGVGTYRHTFGGWSSAGEGPTSTLIHGGAVFVTFEDGTVLSAFAP